MGHERQGVDDGVAKVGASMVTDAPDVLIPYDSLIRLEILHHLHGRHWGDTSNISQTHHLLRHSKASFCITPCYFSHLPPSAKVTSIIDDSCRNKPRGGDLVTNACD